MSDTSFSIEQLCTLADVPVRTLRFYIQKGLVDRPEGERRTARYTQRHLEQLLMIRKWIAAGLSLERISELQAGSGVELPPLRRRPGDLRVQSHLHLREGLELVLDPELAELSPGQVRALANGVMALYDLIRQNQQQNGDSQ
jgi:DNA-binding transcriptional MerR regulator